MVVVFPSLSLLDLSEDFNAINNDILLDRLRKLGGTACCCSGSPSFSGVDSSWRWVRRRHSILGMTEELTLSLSYLIFTWDRWLKSSVTMGWDTIPSFTSIPLTSGPVDILSWGLETVRIWDREQQSSTEPWQDWVVWGLEALWSKTVEQDGSLPQTDPVCNLAVVLDHNTYLRSRWLTWLGGALHNFIFMPVA